MPYQKIIKEKLKMVEAQLLDLLIDRIAKGNAEGRTLTHYTVPSTKKHLDNLNA